MLIFLPKGFKEITKHFLWDNNSYIYLNLPFGIANYRKCSRFFAKKHHIRNFRALAKYCAIFCVNFCLALLVGNFLPKTIKKPQSRRIPQFCARRDFLMVSKIGGYKKTIPPYIKNHYLSVNTQLVHWIFLKC